MSKMNELAMALDEMTEVGNTLITCGKGLIKVASRVRGYIEADTDEPASATEAPEPEPEVAAPKEYKKEEVRALLADLSQNGFRREVKALVEKYSDGGSLKDISPARYPELVAEAEALHA